MAHQDDLSNDDIDESKTHVWVEGGELIVSIFTHEPNRKNHVFEINLSSFTYGSSVEEM